MQSIAKNTRTRRRRWGILEVFAQSGEIGVGSYDGDADDAQWAETLQHHAQEFILPPSVIQKPNASCISDAFGRAYSSAFNVEGLKRIVEDDRIRLSFWPTCQTVPKRTSVA